MFKHCFQSFLTIALAMCFSTGWADEKTVVRHRGFEDFSKGSLADGL